MVYPSHPVWSSLRRGTVCQGIPVPLCQAMPNFCTVSFFTESVYNLLPDLCHPSVASESFSAVLAMSSRPHRLSFHSSCSSGGLTLPSVSALPGVFFTDFRSSVLKLGFSPFPSVRHTVLFSCTKALPLALGHIRMKWCEVHQGGISA
jgi:hypothetical protein